MRPSFHPRLINGPFDDPGLFIPFLFQNRAVIFDLGDIWSLPTKDLLKIDHAFVTHTHMDHFIGFDRLLRILLGREKQVFVYGPEGFLKNVEGKLAAYAWNLVGNYNSGLSLHLTEIRSDHSITREYQCRDRFQARGNPRLCHFEGVLHQEAAFRVSAVILDHYLPCLGLCIHEHFHVNILKAGLEALGLETGPWLSAFKDALHRQADPDSEFEVRLPGRQKGRAFQLGKLAEQIALITPGQKISYITDVIYNDTNSEKIVAFARDSDHLFIEAAFLDQDRKIAKEKGHLTARQAGELAARAAAKQLTVFHFSPRYSGQADLLYREAAETYNSFK